MGSRKVETMSIQNLFFFFQKDDFVEQEERYIIFEQVEGWILERRKNSFIHL